MTSPISVTKVNSDLAYMLVLILSVNSEILKSSTLNNYEFYSGSKIFSTYMKRNFLVFKTNPVNS